MVSGGKRSPKQQQVITISQQWKINIKKILTSPKNEREKKASPQQTCTWCTTPEIYICYFENKLFKLENTKLTHIPNCKSHVPLALSFQILLWPEHWVPTQSQCDCMKWRKSWHNLLTWSEKTPTLRIWPKQEISFISLCVISKLLETLHLHVCNNRTKLGLCWWTACEGTAILVLSFQHYCDL